MLDCLGDVDPTGLPRLAAGEPPLRGMLKATPHDFRVDEVPAYLPSGEGEHLYVRFEKVSLDTREAVRRIARAIGADEQQSGFAGMKDRHAITTQWASFAGAKDVPPDLRIDGVRILEVSRHTNKLRTGHLRANQFDLLLRGADHQGIPAAQAILAELARRGVPNYFGDQRFGRDRENLGRAVTWLVEGGRPPRRPFDRKLYVSTLQSAMFNELLAARVTRAALDRVVDGDLMQKTDTGGLFVARDDPETRERVARFEISATGPMFGAKMRRPELEALADEAAALDRWGLDEAALRRFAKAGAGTRRPYRIPLADAEVTPDPEGVRLRFTLPKGAYATVLARELAHFVDEPGD